VEQRKKTGGSACCRGSRAARRRLQQVRLLLRGGDLTTDGSSLGVGVPGSGRSGFAAAMHRNSSSSGLAGRPDSGVVVLRRGDGLQLHRPAAQQCSSLFPFSSSPPLLHPFFFLTNSGSDMAPTPSCPPSPHLPSLPPPPDCGGSKTEYPKGRLCRGGGGFWGQNPQGRRGTGRNSHGAAADPGRC
jgi:hypothetical protein